MSPLVSSSASIMAINAPADAPPKPWMWLTCPSDVRPSPRSIARTAPRWTRPLAPPPAKTKYSTRSSGTIATASDDPVELRPLVAEYHE